MDKDQQKDDNPTNAEKAKREFLCQDHPSGRGKNYQYVGDGMYFPWLIMPSCEDLSEAHNDE